MIFLKLDCSYDTAVAKRPELEAPVDPKRPSIKGANKRRASAMKAAMVHEITPMTARPTTMSKRIKFII